MRWGPLVLAEEEERLLSEIFFNFSSETLPRRPPEGPTPSFASSTSVFQLPHEGHLPNHCAD
jgi:hypothetical protein